MEGFVSVPELLVHMTEAHATKLLLDAPSPPTFFHGERLLADEEYPQCLSDAECRLLVESMLSAEQKARLEAEEAVMLIVEVPGNGRYRIFATCHHSVVSALITAS